MKLNGAEQFLQWDDALRVSLIFLLVLPKDAELAWTLTGSSNVGTVGEPFTLTCTPDIASTINTVQWSKNGAVVANIKKVNCQPEVGVNTNYSYTCHNGSVFRLNIPVSRMTSDQHNTVWRCLESVFGGQAVYTLNVNTPVTGVTIDEASTPAYPNVHIVYESEPKLFRCTTHLCLPKANVTVTVNGAASQINDETFSLVDELYVTNRTFTVTATRERQAQTVTCTAVNIQGRQPVSQTITLDVYYVPTITLNSASIVIEEGSTIQRTCSSVGHPTPVVNWYRGNTSVTTRTDSAASLSFRNISRSNTGNYTCKATSMNTTYKILQSEESVLVIVQYPPTIQIFVPNDVTENDVNVEIVCDITNGEPAAYKLHGWSQYIGGTRIRSGLNGTTSGNNNKLTLPLLSFGDIGEYKCEIDNGIKGRQPDVIQTVSAYLNVGASAKFNPNDRRIYVEQNKVQTLSFLFYSNPAALIDNITWTNESIGTLMEQSSSISFELNNAAVEKQVHGRAVLLDGQKVSITFKPFLNHYFGNYTINITNGETMMSSFRIQIIETVSIPESSSAGAVIGGVAGSVVILIAIVVIVISVIFYKRRVSRDKSQRRKSGRPAQEYVDLKSTRVDHMYDRCNATTSERDHRRESARSTHDYLELLPTEDSNQHDHHGNTTNQQGASNHNNVTSQDKKYEDLRPTTETNTYEGINSSDTAPVEYVNTKLNW